MRSIQTRRGTFPSTVTIRNAALVAILSVWVTGGAGKTNDYQFVFSTIDPPGAAWSAAVSINPGGHIVGNYRDVAGQHGFLLTEDGFTTIDYPDASSTGALGITPGGDIMGTYQMPGGASGRYLLTRQGDFVPIEVPGYPTAMPQRILPDGSLVGCVHIPAMHGFVMKAGEVSVLSQPRAMHYGATPDGGTMVGRYSGGSADPDHPGVWGYVADGLDFIPFRFPGSTFTEAFDINPAREIVGWYRNPSSSTNHGFLMRNWEFTTLDYPGSLETQVRGINPDGAVVGWYSDGLTWHAFVASRTEPLAR